MRPPGPPICLLTTHFCPFWAGWAKNCRRVESNLQWLLNHQIFISISHAPNSNSMHFFLETTVIAALQVDAGIKWKSSIILGILQPYPILYTVGQGMEIYMIRAENGPKQGRKWPIFGPGREQGRKWSEQGRKWFRTGPKMVRTGPKMVRTGPKMTVLKFISGPVREHFRPYSRNLQRR